MGPNGAGKTTLCKIANGLVIPTKGHLYISGHDSIREHDKIRGKIFTIFGGSRDLFDLFQWRVSVEKNLRFIAELWGIPKEEAKRRINHALELLNLGEKRHEWYQKLSAGMRQKVYLALPVIIQPEVLILDEPTVYLDLFTRMEVWNAIMELSRELGTTVLLTTYNLREAELLCDRVMLFNKSKIAEETPKELIEKVQTLKAEWKIVAKIKGKINPGDFERMAQKIEVQSDGKFTYLGLYFKNEDLREVLTLLSKHDLIDVQTSQVTLEEAFAQLCKK